MKADEHEIQRKTWKITKEAPISTTEKLTFKYSYIIGKLLPVSSARLRGVMIEESASKASEYDGNEELLSDFIPSPVFISLKSIIKIASNHLVHSFKVKIDKMKTTTKKIIHTTFDCVLCHSKASPTFSL